MSGKALFLDRDGTINVDYGYVHEWSKFVFIDGIFDFCRQAQAKGYQIFIITNQSGIERGYFTETDFAALTKLMKERFASEGVTISDVFHCPTLSGPNRKPEPGLFITAKEKYNIDMSASVNVGDSERDIEAGRRAGVGKNFQFRGDFDSIAAVL